MAANPPQLAIEVTGPTEDHASNDNDNDPPPSPLSGDTADNLPAGADEEANSTSSSPRPPLYKSSRLKGYITLLITAVYNYAAAASIAPTRLEEIDWCLFVDDLGRFAVQDVENQSRVRFAKSSAMITEIISAIIIIVHLDIFTGLGDNIWNKVHIYRCARYCRSHHSPFFSLTIMRPFCAMTFFFTVVWTKQ